MSAATQTDVAPAPPRVDSARRRRLPQLPVRFERAWLAPTIFAIANAIAVIIVSPGVNDIWAALARESAVGHGVGLTYWFSWFGGASTPASYSVLEPYISHLIGVRTLAALATVACTPLAWLALRRTQRAEPAVWLATVLAGANLWSGRVPFLFGIAFAVAALVMLQRHHTAWALGFAMLSGLGSPVSGAFLALALVGLFIAEPSYRRACAITLGALGASLIVVAIAFGTPGPEHFSLVETISCAVPLALYLLTRPPQALQVTLGIALIACPLLYVIPNGMGANFQRFAWYCLPPVVVAYAGRRLVMAVVAILPALVFGAVQTSTDVIEATQPNASTQYYATLSTELDRIGAPLRDQRLEVVDDGTHTAAYTLLDHAMLARGWETQEDTELNPVLYSPDLDAVSYKIWLQDNAVGWVAISHGHRGKSHEYTLVSKHKPLYLHEIWHDRSWTLFRVASSDYIVNRPVRITDFSQAKLELHVPCSCRFTVRVHYSRYLTAQLNGRSDDGVPPATLEDDGLGWTSMRTFGPGTYTLSGSLTGLFR